MMHTSNSNILNPKSKLARRTLLLAGGQALIVAVLAARLHRLQVTEASEYRNLAESNRINLRLVTPSRGLIFDRNGIALATNKQKFKIILHPDEVQNAKLVLDNLAKIVPVTEDLHRRVLEEVSKKNVFTPIVISEDATWDQVAKVSVNAPALPGITAERGESRVYPASDDLAHIVGYLGAVSEKDKENAADTDPLLNLPKFQIGKIGIERRLDRQLRGKSGYQKIEINAHGRVIRELDSKPAQPGSNIQLTVDRRLQHYVRMRLSEDTASAVLLDLKHGDVLAIATTPSFDPNSFIGGISHREFDELLANKKTPMVSRAVQGRYPPGSTFKMVTALAALEAGLITSETEFFCAGSVSVSQHNFHCWKSNGHGKVKLNKSLSESCDVFYYNLAQITGIERISAMARRLGFGTRPTIPLTAVDSGINPNRAWKAINRGEQWLIGDTLNTSIGQGFVVATTLQLALMTAKIATGKSLVPRLLRSVDGVEQSSEDNGPVGISAKSLELIRKGMFAAVNSKRGTAYTSRSIENSFTIAGKTGTSQTYLIDEEERLAGIKKFEDLPRHLRDHALFCGYAPQDDPRFAVAVIVEHGGGGSKVAAPIARDILLRAHYDGLPPLNAYPSDQRKKIREEQRALRIRELQNQEAESSRV